MDSGQLSGGQRLGVQGMLQRAFWARGEWAVGAHCSPSVVSGVAQHYTSVELTKLDSEKGSFGCV